MFFVACAYGIVEALPEPAEPPIVEQAQPARPDAHVVSPNLVSGGPCDKRNEVVTFFVDGAATEMEVFVACDPRPYRELGDPPP